MYCGHPRLCVCLSVAACLHYCTDPDVTWGSGRGCPLVVHYWADLQTGHGLRCHGKIMRTRNVSEYMLVLAVCLGVCCTRYLLKQANTRHQTLSPWVTLSICRWCRRCLADYGQTWRHLQNRKYITYCRRIEPRSQLTHRENFVKYGLWILRYASWQT